MFWFDTFLKASEVIIPGEEGKDEGATGKFFEERAREFFSNMPAQAKLTFSAICILLDINAVLRYLRRFPSLSPSERENILRSWESSRIMTRRVMFNALKGLVALIFMSLEGSMRDIKKDEEKCTVE